MGLVDLDSWSWLYSEEDMNENLATCMMKHIEPPRFNLVHETVTGKDRSMEKGRGCMCLHEIREAGLNSSW